MLLYVGRHLVEVHSLGADSGILYQLIGTMSRVAVAAIHKRIGKASDVSAGDPGLWIHKNGRIKSYIVGAFLHEFLPPCALDVIFELNAQGTEIPGVGKTAVYFRSRKYKASVFGKRHYAVHGFFSLFHINILRKLKLRALLRAFATRPRHAERFMVCFMVFILQFFN